jgi:hypothetical protein
MLALDLVFNGKPYPIPRKFIFDLLAHHRDLLDAKSYAVRSSVPPDVFDAFVDALKSETTPIVTRDNAVSLSFLAKEFCLSDLASECAAFSVSVDQFSSLSARVSKLERQLS